MQLARRLEVSSWTAIPNRRAVLTLNHAFRMSREGGLPFSARASDARVTRNTVASLPTGPPVTPGLSPLLTRLQRLVGPSHHPEVECPSFHPQCSRFVCGSPNALGKCSSTRASRTKPNSISPLRATSSWKAGEAPANPLDADGRAHACQRSAWVHLSRATPNDGAAAAVAPSFIEAEMKKLGGARRKTFSRCPKSTAT